MECLSLMQLLVEWPCTWWKRQKAFGLYSGELVFRGFLAGSGFSKPSLSSRSKTLDRGLLKLENLRLVLTTLTPTTLVDCV